MNALLHWLTTPEWWQVVKTLLHSLWQGALIAAALVLIMRRLANPYARYRCSLVALAAIPVAGIITWAILNASNNQPSPAPMPIATAASTSPDLISLDQDAVTQLMVFAGHTPAPPQTHWTAWLALVWLVGAVAMLGRAGVKVTGAERLRRSCQPLDHPQIIQLVAEARRAVGLAREIRVAFTDKLTSPAVVGVLVPTLILPFSLVTTLTPEQIRFILLHELAHIRRGDYFANLFQLFVEALLFFNPAVWWISHQVRREREACCDALAIELSGAPADYARTLVHVAENVLSPTPASATAFGGDREPSSLADRVQRLLVPGYRPSLRLTWQAMIAAFVLGALLLMLCAEGTRVAVAQIAKPLTQIPAPKDPVIRETEPQTGVTLPTHDETNSADRGTVIVEIPQMLGSPFTLKAPSETDSNRPPYLGDMPWVKGLFANTNPSALPTFAGLTKHSQVAYNIEDGYVRATNRGIARLRDMNILADSIELNHKSGKLIAFGNVRVERPEDTNEMTRIELNIYSNQPPARKSEGQMPFTNEKKRAMASKLTGIILERVEFDSEPLSNVVRAVSTEVKRLDPEGRGVNIIISPNAPSPEDGRVVDIAGTRITLQPPLTNVRLQDALEAILKCADKPLKLSIEEYSVVISLKGQEPTPLFTREFNLDRTNLIQGLTQMDRASFVQGLIQMGIRLEDLASTTNISAVVSAMRGFFSQRGVDLDPMQGKSVFYNGKRGILLVRATMDELNRIEQLLSELNRPDPKINIQARFVEVSSSELETFLPDLRATMKTAEGQNWAGFLTAPQMNQVLQRLEMNKGISLLSGGEVTTLSGRQAQLQTVEIKTIVTSINPKALVPPGITSTNKKGSGESLFITTNLSFGPVIDIVPTITPDGYGVAMTVIPRVTEFLGYDGIERPTNSVTVYENGKKGKAAYPLPRFRTQQMTNSAVVRDGMTLVLGAAPVERTTRFKDKVPVLGDIPLVGKLFRSESSQVHTNVLLVFVTPTILKPAAPNTNTAESEESFLTATNLRPVFDILLR